MLPAYPPVGPSFFTDPRLRDSSGLPPAVRPEAGSLPHICSSASVRTEALVVCLQTLKRFKTEQQRLFVPFYYMQLCESRWSSQRGWRDIYRNTSELGKLQVDADYADAEKTQSILQDH